MEHLVPRNQDDASRMGGSQLDLLVGSESQCDSFLISTGTLFSDVGVVKDIVFRSDHWPVTVSVLEPSKRWHLRPSATTCTHRVPRQWKPSHDFASSVNILAKALWSLDAVHCKLEHCCL